MMIEWDLDGLEEQMRTWTAREGLLYYGDYNRPLPKGEPKDDPMETFINRLEVQFRSDSRARRHR